MTAFTIRDSDLDRERPLARTAIDLAGVARQVADVDPGRWGHTQVGLHLLDGLELALATGIEAGKRLTDRIRGTADQPFGPRRELSDDERQFAGAFAARVFAVELGEVTATLLDSPVRVANTFDRDEIRALVTGPVAALPARLLEDLKGYVIFHRGSADPARRVDSAASLARCVHAWSVLLGNTVAALVDDAAFHALVASLRRLEIEILGRRWEGLDPAGEATEEPSELLPISVDDIVGNQDYLRACQRTARDVAGFDFSSGTNPKTINPVLFALGRPGCGKTVTAHAVGNYFLDFCRSRGVAAKFLTIRRTDWASSYQNASANALVDIFREQVAAWPGVVGVYWPDIDTAFAARNSPGVRSEEKNILGAAFGVFDGTLVPHDGKWFMMCDANFMNMDEATISRITQEPFVLEGAKTPEEVVRLLRGVKLRKQTTFLDLDEEDWLAVAGLAIELDLSGRSLANIARRIVTEIQDFEYPNEYYSADLDRRREIIADRSRHLDRDRLLEIIGTYGEFEREAEDRASRDRFTRRVDEIVLNLSAREAALGRLVDDS